MEARCRPSQDSRGPNHVTGLSPVPISVSEPRCSAQTLYPTTHKHRSISSNYIVRGRMFKDVGSVVSRSRAVGRKVNLTFPELDSCTDPCTPLPLHFLKDLWSVSTQNMLGTCDILHLTNLEIWNNLHLTIAALWRIYRAGHLYDPKPRGL